MDARRPADARQRPPEPPEREDFLLFVWLQDVAHGREGLHIHRRRQRLGRRQLIVGLAVSTNCRFWVSTEAGVDEGLAEIELAAVAQVADEAATDDIGVLVEYHLPLTERRIDAMLFGRRPDGATNSLLIEPRWTPKTDN